jgi:hypothetical protein
MFNFFNKPEYKMPEPVSYVEPPKEQEYYSIGVTSEGKMTFKTGITTLTMTRKGCEDLIEQLTVFKNQLREEEDEQS